MILEDFHTHTNYCDGKNTAEEMVRAAIELKMTRLGFSGHSYTSFDQEYSMSLEDTEKYKNEISILKEKYKGEIEIFCGIEQDFYSTTKTDGYDYVIGSVHYLLHGDTYITVDESYAAFKSNCEKYYGGDYYAYAEHYFDTVAKLAECKIDIIGHFDLICKLNRGNRFFDESNPRYLNAGYKALDKLLTLNAPFEINTGAISRGYRDTPYPTAPFYTYIKQHGGKFILSSDSHSKDTLCFKFEQYKNLLTF